MTVKDIVSLIEKTYPPEAARSWDHVGLLVGSPDWNVYAIYVALDATDEVVEHAMSVGADMIITHHPMIFGTMDRVTGDNFTGLWRSTRSPATPCIRTTIFTAWGLSATGF